MREKKINNGKRSLYLDFYPPITHPETNRQTRREHLRLYIFEKPKTETEREQNKKSRLERDAEIMAKANPHIEALQKYINEPDDIEAYLILNLDF